jgi:leucine dehydrogenase
VSHVPLRQPRTEALDDVLRLSRGMTYKSALAGLPLGGGKSVIIGDPRRDKRRRCGEAMGDFLDDLGGRYVAAEDSGTAWRTCADG